MTKLSVRHLLMILRTGAKNARYWVNYISSKDNGIKEIFDDDESSWKVILDEFLQGVGGKFIPFCNFETRKLPIHIPIFFKECLETWS